MRYATLCSFRCCACICYLHLQDQIWRALSGGRNNEAAITSATTLHWDCALTDQSLLISFPIPVYLISHLVRERTSIHLLFIQLWRKNSHNTYIYFQNNVIKNNFYTKMKKLRFCSACPISCCHMSLHGILSTRWLRSVSRLIKNTERTREARRGEREILPRTGTPILFLIAFHVLIQVWNLLLVCRIKYKNQQAIYEKEKRLKMEESVKNGSDRYWFGHKALPYIIISLFLAKKSLVYNMQAHLSYYGWRTNKLNIFYVNSLPNMI